MLIIGIRLAAIVECSAASDSAGTDVLNASIDRRVDGQAAEFDTPVNRR